MLHPLRCARHITRTLHRGINHVRENVVSSGASTCATLRDTEMCALKALTSTPGRCFSTDTIKDESSNQTTQDWNQFTDAQSGSHTNTTQSAQDGGQANPFQSSIDDEEVSKFDFSHDWWSESSFAAALHTMNQLRVPFIRDGLVPQAELTDPVPLSGLRVLDVGSGGGILSEALGRLGASVTGIDALEENTTLASAHVQLDPSLASRVHYMWSTVEDLVASGTEPFDGVVCSEVIEHVNDLPHFVDSCCSLLKPGGSIFFTTINKTNLSYALGIIAAEQIFRVVKAGSHDWNKFVPPGELQSMLQQNGLETKLIHGLTLNPLTLKWCWIKDTSVNYALQAVKPGLESGH